MTQLSIYFTQRLLLYTLIGLTIMLVSSAYPFASNRWHYKSSQHFQVAYNQETAHLANRVLHLAENIADTLASYFGYSMGKEIISIVLYDDTDISNGSAYQSRPLVEIYCRKILGLWRGRTDQLRTILSHELAHIFSLDVMRSPFKVSLGALWHTDRNVNDGDIYTRIESRQVPTWFIEGIAQLGSYEYGADSRDPFREMLLRDTWINDRLLSLSSMARFEGTSREYELVYNQGFDLVLFLQAKAGADEFGQLCRQIRKIGFKNAIKKIYGKSIDELYEEWREELSRRYAQKPDTIPGRKLFQSSDRPMAMVMSCIDNGRYVVSNKRHDYRRFDLFKIKSDNGRNRFITRDVSPFLAHDPETGTVWFAREIYNSRSGVSNYDIFKIENSGRIRRETLGKRCMAFDARDGNLVYATYSRGITQIIRRDATGQQTELYSLSYDTAVYRLSFLSHDSIIVSLGKDDNYSVALLTGNTLHDLWPNQGCHTMDAIAAGRDTLLFVSTLDSTPQLYWCDLRDTSALWYRITNVTGVRIPTVEWEKDNRNVYCSVYEKGGFSVYRLDEPFTSDHPVVLDASDSTTRIKNMHVSEVIKEYPADGFRIPLAPPRISLGFRGRTTSRIDSDGNTTIAKRSGPTLTCGYFLENGPGSFGIFVNAYSFFPLSQKNVILGDLDLDIGITRDIWQFITELYFTSSWYTNQTFENKDKYRLFKSTQREVGGELGYELNDRLYMSIVYKWRWRSVTRLSKLTNPDLVFTLTDDSKIEKDYGITEISNRTILSWKYRNYRSQFDPAHLGSTGSFARFNLELHAIQFPNDTVVFNDSTWEVYYGKKWHSDPTIGTRFYLNARTRLLSRNARISILTRFYGYMYLNNIVNGKLVPRMYGYIGREGLFSGYPNDYLRVDHLGLIELEMCLNPFVNNLDHTRFFERMHLAAKIEYGLARYYENGKSDWFQPITGEIALRFYWYLRARVQSSIYFKYAFPLSEIDIGEPAEPFRIYFGMTL